MKKINIIIALLLSVTLVMAQDKGSVLIKNGTVITVTNGTLDNTDVLIRDGKISKIGQGLSAPSGAKTIDANVLSKHIQP